MPEQKTFVELLGLLLVAEFNKTPQEAALLRGWRFFDLRPCAMAIEMAESEQV